ncbi:MAG: YIP1 family protein [Dehalococcoidia bacterium]|nr:YIP1 family protein [Dehalococcoidia bacterium]
MDPNVIINRIIRLAKLDTTVFDEVRDDPAELIPALIVAGVSALLAGLGAFLWWQFNFDFTPDSLFLNTFILGGIFLAAMYAVWVLLAYVMLVQVFKATADLQALFRTMGYAAVPFALSLLMFIPVLHPVFAIVPLVLVFVMAIYAVQSVTSADSTQVVIANTVGLTVMVLVLRDRRYFERLPGCPHRRRPVQLDPERLASRWRTRSWQPGPSPGPGFCM